MNRIVSLNTKLLKRDPFARTELHQQRVYGSVFVCNNCGHTNKTPVTGRDFLFQYITISDGGTKNHHSGLFCTVGCFREYHNAY